APPAEDAPAASHRLIVKLTPAAMAAGRETGVLGSLLAAHGVTASMPLLPAPAPAEADAARAEFDRIFVLELPESADMDAAVAAFGADPRVEYAEIDHILSSALVPRDPRYVEQWSLDNAGLWGCAMDADIDAPEAWRVTTGLPSRVIAVIDSGIDMDNPDLAAKIVPGYDFAYDDTDPADDIGHGTHVSGIAAALSNNAAGIAGVCWACRIMPLKALAGSRGQYSWLEAALIYAADHRASVVNMSLGGSVDSITLHDAVRYVYGSKIPMVVAMMNNASSAPAYPAAYPEVIAVGATDCTDGRASFSNVGSHIDLVAPGVDILSTLPNGAYERWNGTSMATPHVTGVVGLMRSLNPTYSPAQIRSILKATADDQVGDPAQDTPGWDQYFGSGRLNAAAAVRAVADALSVFSTTSQALDGWVLEAAEDAEVGGARNTVGTAVLVGDNAQNRQYRGILSFNTSGLPDNAVIVFATLELKLKASTGNVNFSTTHGRLLVDARKAFFGAVPGVELADFEAPAGTAAAGAFTVNPVAGWHTAAIARAAFPQIDPRGLTQFRIEFAADDDNDGVADYAAFHSGDAVVPADRPALVIQYYVP
ncbi:MAG TPA: S8 family serine peptidase, partial [bacterium]